MVFNAKYSQHRNWANTLIHLINCNQSNWGKYSISKMFALLSLSAIDILKLKATFERNLMLMEIVFLGFADMNNFSVFIWNVMNSLNLWIHIEPKTIEDSAKHYAHFLQTFFHFSSVRFFFFIFSKKNKENIFMIQFSDGAMFCNRLVRN